MGELLDIISGHPVQCVLLVAAVAVFITCCLGIVMIINARREKR